MSEQATRPQPTAPMSRGRLIAWSLAALAAAVLIVFGAILPAEYDKDYLGLGRITGISRLWAPDEVTVNAKGAAGPLAREYPDIPYREDFVEIPLGGFLTGAQNSELEWKVRMQKGATVTYSWEAVGAERPDDVFYEHHGHDLPAAGQGMTVSTYRKASGLKQAGALTAPFDGIHGWFFQNSSEKPVVIRIRISGFYRLIRAGSPGNEANVVPNVPAAQARPDAPLALKAAP